MDSPPFHIADECAPPSNYLELKSSLNVNGSICLNQVCHYDNRTIGEACELENLVFVGWDANGNEFPDIRSRDKCVALKSPRLFPLFADPDSCSTLQLQVRSVLRRNVQALHRD